MLYYIDYTMNLTSKGLTVASSTGLVLLNKEKKIFNAFNA